MAVMDYRSQDGFASYAFSIEFNPDVGWRVYIVFRPLYQGGDETSKWPHEAIDGSGRSYISWPAKLGNLGDARTVAALWAENAEHFARGLAGSGGEEAKKAKNSGSIKQRKPEAGLIAATRGRPVVDLR